MSRRKSGSGTYRVFKRAARNWEEFARARKMTVDRGLTYDEAQRACKRMNDERTAAEVRRGLKYEFMQE